MDSLRKISFNNSNFVFIGELIEFDTIEYTFTFRIIEVFKGDSISAIIKGKVFDSCSLFPREKSNWIVYADLKEGLIDISQCLASRSEISPICINCYKIPNPYRNIEEMKKGEGELSLLKNKALGDWKNEIEFLRANKID
jgi:hypothetical protein